MSRLTSFIYIEILKADVVYRLITEILVEFLDYY